MMRGTRSRDVDACFIGCMVVAQPLLLFVFIMYVCLPIFRYSYLPFLTLVLVLFLCCASCSCLPLFISVSSPHPHPCIPGFYCLSRWVPGWLVDWVGGCAVGCRGGLVLDCLSRSQYRPLVPHALYYYLPLFNSPSLFLLALILFLSSSLLLFTRSCLLVSFPFVSSSCP